MRPFYDWRSARPAARYSERFAFMRRKIPRKIERLSDRLFEMAEDPSLLFNDNSERSQALFKMIKSKADGWRKPGRCMYRGCPNLSIANSHSIQRTGPISQLLEKGHVLTPKFWNGGMQLKSVGASDASTFPGFCTRHEAIFLPFERTSSISTDEHVELQTFRTICREIRRKSYDVQQLEELLAYFNDRLESKAKEQAAAQKVEFKSITVQGGVFGKIQEMIDAGKKTVDDLEKLYDLHFDAIDNKVRTRLSGFCIQSNLHFPVALSGLIQHRTSTANHTWIAGVIPQAGGSLIFLAGQPNDQHIINQYMIDVKISVQLIDLVEAWMVLHTDHWFLKPSVWQAIPAHRQDQILTDILDVSKSGLSYEWSIFDDLRRAAMVVPAPVLLGRKEEEIFAIQRAKMN